MSKATIYNHWADKEALLLEVMLLVNGLDREPEDVDSGDLLPRPDHGAHAQAARRIRCRTRPHDAVLIAYSAVHPEFGKAWRHRVMEPPRQCIKRILRRGIERGQLPRDLDLDSAIALLLGPMLYAHIFQREQKPKALDLGPLTAQAFWRAHRQARQQHIKKAGIKKPSRKK